MIKNIIGKKTKDIVEKGETKKFTKRQNKRALLLMMALADSNSIEDIKAICEPPSLKLHKLKGNMKEYWSITIDKPWCIIFKYDADGFSNVEIGDYHD